jgi:cysteine sulfinate desulfinase/cysteine desulfurase-like protein
MLVCVQVVINEVGALPTGCEVLHMPHQFQLVVAVQLTSLAGALQVTVKEWMPSSASHSKTCICTSLHGHLIHKINPSTALTQSSRQMAIQGRQKH